MSNFDFVISYCKTDGRKIALHLEHALVDKGYTVWAPRNADNGDAAISAIDDCRYFLPVITEGYHTSRSAMDQLSYALDRAKTIIPLICGSAELSEELLKIVGTIRCYRMDGLLSLLQTIDRIDRDLRFERRTNTLYEKLAEYRKLVVSTKEAATICELLDAICLKWVTSGDRLLGQERDLCEEILRLLTGLDRCVSGSDIGWKELTQPILDSLDNVTDVLTTLKDPLFLDQPIFTAFAIRILCLVRKIQGACGVSADKTRWHDAQMASYAEKYFHTYMGSDHESMPDPHFSGKDTQFIVDTHKFICVSDLSAKERLYSLRCALLGEEHPDSVDALNDLATAYGEAGLYEKKLELKEKLYALRCALLGEDDPDAVDALNDLATAYGEAGHFEKGLELSKKVYSLRYKIVQENHPDALTFLGGLAAAYDEAEGFEKKLDLSLQADMPRYDTLHKTDHAPHDPAFDHVKSGDYHHRPDDFHGMPPKRPATPEQMVSRREDEILTSIASFMQEGNQLFDVLQARGLGGEFLQCLLTSYERLKNYCEIVGAKNVAGDCIDRIVEIRKAIDEGWAGSQRSEKAEKGIKSLLGVPLMGNGDYDVFISFKSEDSDLAQKIYELAQKHLKIPFWSKKTLPQMSKSDYLDAIYHALQTARHFVVVLSKLEYLSSNWVRREMETFELDITEGRKKDANFVFVVTDEVYDTIIRTNKVCLDTRYRRYQIIKMSECEETLMQYIN